MGWQHMDVGDIRWHEGEIYKAIEGGKALRYDVLGKRQKGDGK